jgi:hypothetical protein
MKQLSVFVSTQAYKCLLLIGKEEIKKRDGRGKNVSTKLQDMPVYFPVQLKRKEKVEFTPCYAQTKIATLHEPKWYNHKIRLSSEKIPTKIVKYV